MNELGVPKWREPQDLTSQGAYLWGGLAVDSNLALHRLPETAADANAAVEPDVTFRWRSNEPAPPPPPNATRGAARRTLRQKDGTDLVLEIGGTPEDLRFAIDDVGTFVLRPLAGTIDLYPVATAEPMRAEHSLVNAVLATFLGLRGEICLHAAAVAKDGGAIVFTGPSGIGKSTRAWRMVSQGWELMSDDVVVIRRSDATGDATEGWKLFPGSRSVRLEGLEEPGSWDNRGKGEVLLTGAGGPCSLDEIRLVLAGGGGDEPLGPAKVQASLLKCQWGWNWANPDARRDIDASMWDLINAVPVKTEVWDQ